MSKSTVTFTLTLEIEVYGVATEDEMIENVMLEIQGHIPGVLCDDKNYTVAVNSTEMSFVSIKEEP